MVVMIAHRWLLRWSTYGYDDGSQTVGMMVHRWLQDRKKESNQGGNDALTGIKEVKMLIVTCDT